VIFKKEKHVTIVFRKHVTNDTEEGERLTLICMTYIFLVTNDIHIKCLNNVIFRFVVMLKLFELALN